jgi:hypothetical protein
MKIVLFGFTAHSAVRLALPEGVSRLRGWASLIDRLSLSLMNDLNGKASLTAL